MERAVAARPLRCKVPGNSDRRRSRAASRRAAARSARMRGEDRSRRRRAPRRARGASHRRDPSTRRARSASMSTAIASAVFRRLAGAPFAMAVSASWRRAAASIAPIASTGVARNDFVGMRERIRRLALARERRSSASASGRSAGDGRSMRACDVSVERSVRAVRNRAHAGYVRDRQSRCAALRSRPAPSLRSRPPKSFLKKARQLAALGLARLLFFAGQPGDLDHAALALVRQVAVERIVRRA